MTKDFTIIVVDEDGRTASLQVESDYLENVLSLADYIAALFVEDKDDD